MWAYLSGFNDEGLNGPGGFQSATKGYYSIRLVYNFIGYIFLDEECVCVNVRARYSQGLLSKGIVSDEELSRSGLWHWAM